MHVIGLSIHHAAVDVREKLAIAQADWVQAAADLVAYSGGVIEEAAVLSTQPLRALPLVARPAPRTARRRRGSPSAAASRRACCATTSSCSAARTPPGTSCA